jgi:hypothetical protein
MKFMSCDYSYYALSISLERRGEEREKRKKKRFTEWRRMWMVTSKSVNPSRLCSMCDASIVLTPYLPSGGNFCEV